MSSSILLRLVAPSSDGGATTGDADARSIHRKGSEQNWTSGPTRRAIKQHALARGLARQYNAQRAREDATKTRLLRLLEKKQRAQGQTIVNRLDRRSPSPVRIENVARDSSSDVDRDDSDGECDADENGVVLVLRPSSKTPNTANPRQGSKSHDRRLRFGDDTERVGGSRTLVVPARHPAVFSGKCSLRRDRVLQTNQLEGDSEIEDRGSDTDNDALAVRMATSTEADISSLQKPHQGTSNALTVGFSVATTAAHPIAAGGGGSMSHWRPDRSSTLVLCELRVAKEIMAREQALRQLCESVAAFDRVTRDLIETIEAKKAAEAAAGVGAARMFRMRRGSSSSITLARPDSGAQSQTNAATTAALKQNVEVLSSKVDKLTERMHLRGKQIETLVKDLREATVRTVEGVEEWRGLQRRRRTCSNFDPLMRFRWRNGKVPNYVLHLQSDVRALFSSTAVTYLLGADAEFNALLLPRLILSLMSDPDEADGAAASPSNTFLTDKVTAAMTGACTSGNEASTTLAAFDQSLFNALIAVVPRQPAGANGTAQLKESIAPHEIERWRNCLNLIKNEAELEKRERERCEQDANRMQRSYNPFHAIKAVGGVDEQLSVLLAEQSPHVEKLRQQLRHRQQDATDYAASPVPRSCGGVAGSTEDARSIFQSDRRLHISRRRLHLELQRRREASEAALQCEAREAVVARELDDSVGVKRNRLQGKVLVRKQAIPIMTREDYLASIIQRQFRAYRARGNVLQSLAGLVGLVRGSTVAIQRVYRGHVIKHRFQDILAFRNEQRRRRIRAARMILLAYRRYKRRQRHRQSITVVAVAQAQLQSILVSKSHDADEAAAMKNEETERLRKLGAERRRHRAAMMEQQRREQLALEVKQTAAAIKIQSIMRSQLAQHAANTLREEKKAHIAAVSVITIQSNIRTFLVRQEARRLRFRKDLDRVNRSAERIQRVYRDYSLRAHETPIEAVNEVDESYNDDEAPIDGDPWDGKLPPLHHSTSQADSKRSPSPAVDRVALPPLTRPTASSKASRRPSRQLVTPPTASTVAMARVELKLKEPVIEFQTASVGSNSARRGSFQGWHGRA